MSTPNFGGGPVRPSWRRLFNKAGRAPAVADLSLGRHHEKVGADDPEESAASASLVAPAIGSSALIVDRGLEPGSVLVSGSYTEGTHYEIIYGENETLLKNLAIPAGTALSVIYFDDDEGEGARVSEVVMSGNPSSEMVLDDEGDAIMAVVG